VLGALREQDARVDEIIRVQQVAKGRGEVFNPRAFAERVLVLGPLVALEVLEHHVGAVILNSLGTSWDERYGQLVAFTAQHGNCWVPQIYPESPRLLKCLLCRARCCPASARLSSVCAKYNEASAR
jgi:hypothetical protein